MLCERSISADTLELSAARTVAADSAREQLARVLDAVRLLKRSL
jgi:hypothetical protein